MVDAPEGFLEQLCERRSSLVMIGAVAMAFLALSSPFLVFADPGSPAFVISSMNAVGFSIFAVGAFATIRYCDRR